MVNIAYFTNSSRQQAVGLRAHHVRRELAADRTIALTPFLLDGEKNTVSRSEQQIFNIAHWPGPLAKKSVSWLRLGRRLSKYIRQDDTQYQLYHFTNQTLSFLARRLRPAIVTVHDIIELTDPQDSFAYFINRRLYSGIRQADHIIAVSKYTKQELVERLAVPSEQISVIPNGVSADFHPIPDFTATIGYQELRRTLRLDRPAGPIVLYVGSEHPRKNLSVAIHAFAKLRLHKPQAIFIKVGQPGLLRGRQELLADIEKHHLRSAIRWLADVSSERLNELYNLADVLIYPSWLEGFGLPPLEAMAAGTPVVCSNASSLPEVVGEAAITHHPEDVDSFAASLLQVVSEREVAARFIQLGLERAARFSWKTAAEQEARLYKTMA